MSFITSILSFISNLFSFLHDRKVAEGAKADDIIQTQKQVIEDVKKADDIRESDLPDSLLIDPKDR